jgi:hypothetical protein
MARLRRAAVVVSALSVAACAGTPTPDWALDAHASVDAAIRAHLNGESRVEVQEFARARSALARTGRLDLVARAELARCAARVASLEFEPCAGFDALRADAAGAERAYADYLRGEIAATDVERLPPRQRAIATAREDPAKALAAIDEPLARLVAAGVLMRTGRARPEIVSLAVDTASSQGWRRALLAWLNVQLRLAQQGGAPEDVARVQRRIDLVGGR